MNDVTLKSNKHNENELCNNRFENVNSSSHDCLFRISNEVIQ